MAPKRKAAFAMGSVKKSRKTPTATVVNALADSAALPENLRNLLKHTLPIVLGANKADRHAFEIEVVDQAQQGLVTVQASIEAAHAAALAKQNDVVAPAERGKRSAAKNEADAKSETAKATLEASKATKKSAEKDVHQAEEALKAALKASAAADKAMKRTSGKRDILANAVEKELALVRGSAMASTSADGKKALKTLLALGKEYGLDSTLLSTLPSTCKKEPAARSEFETKTFDSLKALMDNEIEGLSQKVAEAEPGVAAALSAVGAAQGALGTAQATEKAAGEALTTAHGAYKDATKAAAKAGSHQRQIWEDMRAACEAQDSLASDLTNFREQVLVAFQALKEKEPEPEPVEEPAPVEEEPPRGEAPVGMEESTAPAGMADAA